MKTERSEPRMDVIMAGRLAAAGTYPASEWVAIKNISGHGARIISNRRWRIHDAVCLGETVGSQHLDAEVVYCVRLEANRFAVGLRFTSPTMAYDTVTAPRERTPEFSDQARAR
jgi:hypothetical protein